MDKPIVVILEGEDHSGKSDIAKALGRLLRSSPYRPNGQEIMRGDNLELIKNKILEGITVADILNQTKYSIIFDRYYPSEFVYAKVFNRIFHEKELREVDIAFSKLNTFRKGLF